MIELNNINQLINKGDLTIKEIYNKLLDLIIYNNKSIYFLEANYVNLTTSSILPEAPNNDEKYLYLHTNRFFLLSWSFISLGFLSAGMWLFVISSPYFYWFGAPTFFILGYLLISYFGIAIWGSDFSLDNHNEILKQSQLIDYYPIVDIYLPICGESIDILINTWNYVSQIDWPNKNIYVLDDGAREDIRILVENFYNFNYIVRPDRPTLKKAGNLRYAFSQTNGEFILILDADFCPRSDILRETIPYFLNNKIGILQTPQYFRYSKNQSWIEQGAVVTQELFYRMVQINRNKYNAAICVGTCGIYRRMSLEPFGGTAAIGYSEDVHTGFNVMIAGYNVCYIPIILGMGICPNNPQSFFIQQYRWCMGSITLMTNHEFWLSKLTIMQKLCFISGMCYYLTTAMSVITNEMPGILLIWLHPKGVFFYNICFAIPSILFSVIIMRLWAKQGYPFSANRIRIIQYYAHLFAIKDKLLNMQLPWVTSGSQNSSTNKSTSKSYDNMVKFMVLWQSFLLIMVISSSTYRFNDYEFYNFMPTIASVLFNYIIHMSIFFNY